MENNVNMESLLGNSSDNISLFDSGIQEDLETPVTLLGGMNDNLEVSDEEKRVAEIAKRRKFFMNPENQAELLMQNYLMSNPGIILTGKQKRTLRREFLKNAKKGKYRRLFEKQVNNLPSEDTKETFQNLNA